MKYYLLMLVSLFALNTQSNFIYAEANNPKDEALKKIAEVVHPDVAEIWKTFFSNFDSDGIIDWYYSESTSAFSITLKHPFKLWVPASKHATSEPRPGSILIFGTNNRVEGRLNPYKKSIEFNKGFQVYCKHKIGFFTIPIMVDVYSFTYKNPNVIIFEAGKAGISEKRTKSLEKYLISWANPTHVVAGDYEAFLNAQSR